MSTPHATTLPPAGHGRKPRLPARWAIEASRQVGYQPMTCEKRVQLGIHEEVGHYVTAALASGAGEIAAKLAQPVLLALDRTPALPLNEAIRKAQRADALEEIAETSYLTNPTDENRLAFVAALRAQVATSMHLVRALEAL